MKNCNWVMMGPMMPMMMWNMAMARSCAPKKGSCTTKNWKGHSAAQSSGTEQAPVRDIVDTAIGAGLFSRLVEAVKAGGLVETLKSAGPFTVFAPSDEAFAKLPPEALEAALKDTEQLKSILTYHVVPGMYRAADLGGISALRTVQGSALAIDLADGVKVGNSRVVKADIPASNGVIHVIDSVLMP